MAIPDRDLTGQTAYYPGFGGVRTSEEPFFLEIDESPCPTPPPPPGWLPAPKRQAPSEAPRSPIAKTPSRPAKSPSPGATGGKRAFTVNAPPEEPEEELSWQEQVVRWIQGEGGAGFGISMLVHVVLLLALSLWVLNPPNQDEDLITTLEETEAAVLPTLQDVEIVAMDVDEPEMKDPNFDPGLDFGTVSENLNLSSLDVGLNASAGSLTGTKGGGWDIRIPSQAVTKGSFTVWTEPVDPQPGQRYTIMIRVKLKSEMQRYPRSDLSGNVVGTDLYRDFFGGPTESGYLPVKDSTVLYQALQVPGAQELVKDIITVESKILGEKQVIELVF